MINKKENKLIIIILAVYSILLKFFVSMNSIMYDKVFTDADESIFYGIGKSIIKGKVLYKDVFDHKTPYIYFFNAIASLLDYNHLGLYIIEVVLLFITLYFTFKLLLIVLSYKNIYELNNGLTGCQPLQLNYINAKYCTGHNVQSNHGVGDDILSSRINIYVAFISTLLLGTILTYPNITFGYSRTEEYAIACLMPAIYLFAKYFYKLKIAKKTYIDVKNNVNSLNERTQDKNINSNIKLEFSIKEIFIIGILAGITFMTNIRATILFVPFAIVLFIKLFFNKLYKNILSCLMFGLCGVVVSILPYIIYMIVTNSTADMIDAVLVTNFSYFSSDVASKGSVFETAFTFMKEHMIFYVMFFVSLVIILLSKIDRYLKFPILASGIIAFMYVTLCDRAYDYYLVILMPYLIAIPVCVLYFILKIFNKKNTQMRLQYMQCSQIIIICSMLIILTITSLCYFGSINTRSKNAIKRATKMSNTIFNYYQKEKGMKDISEMRDLKVLAFGFNPEVYIYLEADINYKYFIVPHLSYAVNSKAFNAQYSYLNKRDPDVVVYRAGEIDKELPKTMINQVYFIFANSYVNIGKVITNGEEGEYYIFAKR